MDGKCLMTDDELNEIEARHAQSVNVLIAKIKNIPIVERFKTSPGYKWGHKDARNAAADIAASHCMEIVEELRRLRADMEELRSLRKLLSQSIDMDGPSRGRWVWVADGPLPADEEAQA